MTVETQNLGPADTFSDSRDPNSLFAGNMEAFTRPILLDNGVAYTRGCVVYAADQDATFVKVAHGALPAATDVVGVVSEDIDLTDAANDAKHVMYIGPAEFVYDTLGKNSKDDLTAADWKALIETMISKGMNVVKMTYGTFTPAP